MRAFPLHALPPRMRDAVTAQAGLGNYDVGAVASAALAIASHAGQGLHDVEDPSQHGKAYPCSTLFMILMKSGDAKSSIYDRLFAAVREWQDAESKNYDDAMIVYNAEREVWDQAVRTAKKANCAITLASAMRNEPVKPLDPRNTGSKVTTNGIFKYYDRGLPTYGLFTDEAGSLLASHSLKKDNGPVEFASLLTTLWNGGEVDRETGSERARLLDRRLSGLLMVQPEVARDFLNNAQLKQQGLHARINIIQPDAWVMLKQDFNDPHEIARREKLAGRVDAFNDRIRELLDRKIPRHPFDHQRIKLSALSWHMDARAAALAIQHRCVDMRNESDETYWMRLFEHVCRIAGVLTIFEGSAVGIMKDTVEAAWEIVQFYAEQWENLDVEVSDERGERLALLQQKVMKAITAAGGSIRARDLNRKVFQRTDQRDREAILSKMVAEEYISAGIEMIGTKQIAIYEVAR